MARSSTRSAPRRSCGPARTRSILAPSPDGAARVSKPPEKLQAEHGIDCEVIDVRSLVPLDAAQTILRSVARTHRLFTVEENPRLCGWGAEIASIAADEAFYDLDGPIVRITTRISRCRRPICWKTRCCRHGATLASLSAVRQSPGSWTGTENDDEIRFISTLTLGQIGDHRDVRERPGAVWILSSSPARARAGIANDCPTSSFR